MVAGADVYEFTEENRTLHDQLDWFCRHRSLGTIRFRDLVAATFHRTGYDTPEKVVRFVDELTPKVFEALGEPFHPEYLQDTRSVRRAPEGRDALCAARVCKAVVWLEPQQARV